MITNEESIMQNAREESELQHACDCFEAGEPISLTFTPAEFMILMAAIAAYKVSRQGASGEVSRFCKRFETIVGLH